MAYAIACKRHLRFERELTELKDVLPASDLEDITKAGHMPSFVLHRLTKLLYEARRLNYISDIQLQMLDANLTDYEDEIGACERILKTPMPFAYVVHLRTFLFIWLAALPFGVVKNCRWGTIPVCCVAAYSLMGFEDIGVEIENPFGHDFNDLPLDSITTTITTNLQEQRTWLPRTAEDI